MTDPGRDAYRQIIALLDSMRMPARGSVGASAVDLASLDEFLGFQAPSSVREWLTVCNGPIAGPGWLLGVRGGELVEPASPQPSSPMTFYRGWRGRRWIPVANDGFGNYYVVDASHSHLATDGVFFVDVHEDPNRLAYAAGSHLTRFLVFLLEAELGETGWPFDRAYVLARDGDLAGCSPASLLPWNRT